MFVGFYVRKYAGICMLACISMLCVCIHIQTFTHNIEALTYAHVNMNKPVCLSNKHVNYVNSLCMYVYGYIYIERERGRERFRVCICMQAESTYRTSTHVNGVYGFVCMRAYMCK